jgi:1L-myo-inositol 1-phosphate cytidylyltransferase / CDP-L-myo-inositol myo-inositolphosphotransferase
VKDLELLRSGDACPCLALNSEADLPRAERFLLRGLVKDTEGFMSRHFERTLSLALSRRLAATSVTPNAMTLISVGVGLLGAVFFLEPTSRSETVGALLFLLHSILDGCDGELARLKFQESRYGGILDFWGDNVVHVAVFAAMAIGWSRVAGASWPLLLGALAAGGALGSAFLVYSETMAAPKEGPLFTSVAGSRPSRLSRIADALSRRDFIYLVLILSLFGKARWFLVLAAAGAPVYFLALTVIALAERRRPRSAR